LRCRRRKKIVRQRVAQDLPSKAGIRWSMDFVFDRTERGPQAVKDRGPGG